MFVTLFCALFDLRAMKLACASMGHPSPVLLRRGVAPSLPFASTGMVAGIVPGTEVLSQSLDLQAGDSLVFYTDGVTEAFNDKGEQFGERRLLEHLATAVGQSAAQTVASTIAAVRTHAGDHPQSDDITLVAVRCAP
jgi:sigma-B regulation protein RsbU (phosphoserine phosphatase)